MIQFILNQKEITTDLPKGMLLLDFIRYQQRLTGTKIGCREGDCGACTVLTGEIVKGELVYRSVTSCLMPLANAHGKHIVTIEGVNIEGLNFIQQSFANEGATQCGFCTPGFIVSIAGYCLREKAVNGPSGIDAVNGNICRCTGYKSIERAIATIETKLAEKGAQNAIDFAVENKLLPGYFSTIKERLKALNLPQNSSRTANTNFAKFLSGGTDLYVQQHDTLPEEDIDFLLDKKDLKGIRQLGNRCILGAAVTVTDILESSVFQQYFPDLKKHIKLVSSTQIRNMATIAGNIINGSPIGDFTIFFLALDAKIILTDGFKSREIPLSKLYRGYKTLNKTADEYIDQIYFELPGANSHFSFEKVCKRTHLDIATVNSAIHLIMEGDTVAECCLTAGGIGPIPLFLENSSIFMRGKKINIEVVTGLIEMAQSEISPISDARGTAMYKRFLLGQLIKAHFVNLVPKHLLKDFINT